MSNHLFAKSLIAWQQKYGRHDLPWQQDRSAYRVWISEIMLQQTQVNTVIPYFQRFMRTFPDVTKLSSASEEAVLTLWSGLGYYARGRNIHRAAHLIALEFSGELPQNLVDLQSLPGIGRSTAGAILSLAYHERAAIMDGNVKRVFARVYGMGGDLTQRVAQNKLWDLAEAHLPRQHFATYTQSLMDLGALVCTRTKPKCELCPIKGLCHAYQTKTQALYPAKKVKLTKPHKSAYMLLVCNSKGQIYLEKRPSRGIWGGLWSLPEVEGSDNLKLWLTHHWQLRAPKFLELTTWRHSFTHFDLTIMPVMLKLTTLDAHRIFEKRAGVWYNPNQASKLALCAPVKRILQEYIQSGSSHESPRILSEA